ncbi:MAG: LysR family transcriptional regulator [Raoultibacter sp.]
MDIEILRDFIALSDNLNITKTSRELNIAQSTLSAHIISLEKDVGVKLVDRNGKPRLTPAGRKLLETASDIVNLYDGFKKRNKQDGFQQDGSILVQVPKRREAILVALLQKIVEFKGMYPHAKMDLREVQSGGAMDDLETRWVDCSYFGNYVRQPVAPGDYDLIPLIDEELIIWMDEDSPLLGLELLSPADMEGYVLPVPVGGSTINGCLPVMYEELFSAYGAKPNIKPRYCESIDDFILSKIKRGDLIILNPGSQAIEAMSSANRRVARCFNPSICSTAYLAFRRGDQDSMLGRFKEFILHSYE